MIQRFIELGEGYSDLYELIEIANTNKHRLVHLMAFHTTIDTKELSSLAVVLEPTDPGHFQPIYICREGVPNPEKKPNKRYDLFKQLADEMGKEIITFKVKPSSVFAENELYYQHLIAILRLNHYIPPMQ